MYLLVFSVGQHATKRGRRTSVFHDLDLSVVPLRLPDAGSGEHSAYDVWSETIRSKYQLTTQHRTRIADWLLRAKVGDALLLPRVMTPATDTTPDDLALVLGGDTAPQISRVVTREVVSTVMSLEKLPVGKKVVKKGDLKKGKNARK